ncbi:agmatine hydroxycinnamoyltransferase 1 [Oryza brachyantha]|uniref:agmatine hydroxycinnamoyltransferase 1 n=1 Tax=Oryza brachyantha TaxID=4533 RepID=UPI001ADC6DE2|nr:agmatine hydroxycinnamoyltransferase 1 [Oryza brachyantha]
MKITVHSSKPVKPAYGGAVSAAAVTTTTADDDVVPLTVFDKANFDTYVSVIYAFRPPAPANAVLEAGLAKALAEYREWAGRFGVDGNGDRAIVLNDAGARFVEATADVALDSVLPLEPTPRVTSLHPSADDGAEEVMMVQLTRFACGSLVVGFTAHHMVSDGRATSNFFLAWSQATRGVAIHPVPVHDRASFFAPRDPPQVDFEHRGVEFKTCDKIGRDDDDDDDGHADNDDDVVVIHKVHFSREFISKLKTFASAGGHRSYSTLQCVVAHLWRCITMARGLDGREATSVSIAVDGRARMSPPVPDGYTGNVVLWARPTATARELVTAPLQHAVGLINREVSRINDGYFKSFIDFASSGAVEEERLVSSADAAEMVLSPNIEVDSWLRIPFYELDFGGGQPFLFTPSYLPVEGLLILLPSFSGDGSVDAYVPLFSHDMDTFKNCCYVLPDLS